MKMKNFTLLIAFVVLLGGMANAQSETGLAKKIDRKGKIVKLNNHRNTKAAIFSEDFSDVHYLQDGRMLITEQPVLSGILTIPEEEH